MLEELEGHRIPLTSCFPFCDPEPELEMATGASLLEERTNIYVQIQLELDTNNRSS